MFISGHTSSAGARFDRGKEQVVEAMRHFAGLAARGREALRSGDALTLAALMNENFDMRRRIYRLPQWQIVMVEAARQAGASAKFAGSGGAIVGTYAEPGVFDAVRASLGALGCRTIVPQVVEP